MLDLYILNTVYSYYMCIFEIYWYEALQKELYLQTYPNSLYMLLRLLCQELTGVQG